jgi:hypothetical protein
MDPSATQLTATNGRSEAGRQTEGNGIAMKLELIAMNRPVAEVKRAAVRVWLGMRQ